MSRVLVAMSGGVDSSVAALLLHQQGHEVIGLTMQLWQGDRQGGKGCCSHTDINDARTVAEALGFPHYVLNYEQEFKTQVVDYFADEYFAGRTPNPCVMCNSKLKFSHLMQKAKSLHAQYIATGHYAKMSSVKEQPALLRADDQRKDQSYFLFSLQQQYLPKLLFPLATKTKAEVRALARQHDICNAEKEESQDICFVNGGNYSMFLQKNYPTYEKTTGDFVSRTGEVLGKHQGIHHFTVGQRRGLGVALGERRYVIDIDKDKGQVVLGSYADLQQQHVYLGRINWLVDEPVSHCEVVTRYHGASIPCKIKQLSTDKWQLTLAAKALASPGQAAVLYQDDRVLGGGFIRGREESAS